VRRVAPALLEHVGRLQAGAGPEELPLLLKISREKNPEVPGRHMAARALALAAAALLALAALAHAESWLDAWLRDQPLVVNSMLAALSLFGAPEPGTSCSTRRAWAAA